MRGDYVLSRCAIAAASPSFGGCGIAPSHEATHAPMRLAVSFIAARDDPRRNSWTKPAVKASPAPTASLA